MAVASEDDAVAEMAISVGAAAVPSTLMLKSESAGVEDALRVSVKMG